MTKIEERIQEKNLERVNSIYYRFTNDHELIKGVANDLGYTADLNINKKGKEIKEKLSTDIITTNSKKSDCFAEMKIYISKIKIAPIIDISNEYPAKEYSNVLKIVPYRYCRTQMYPEGSTYETLEDEDKVKITNMVKYNQIVNDYIRISIEVIKLNTVINNLQDNKSYKLSLELASKLGF